MNSYEKDLNWIKRKYGEKMMHLCRDNFSRLFDVEGLVPSLLEKNFYQYHNLAQEIIEQNKINDFKSMIFEQVDLDLKITQEVKNKSAKELLAEAGYILYPECKTEADIQSFRHYYYRQDGTPIYQQGKEPERCKDEELCTFNGGRLDNCRVWFAVKSNIDEIKRSNKPERQDEYGTSVISIQFTKSENSTLSIKNRYNHVVTNPDATFNNNLDNIVKGLACAFERDYGVKDVCSHVNFEMDNYVIASDGKYYPYNYEINNIYYCPNNIVIDHFDVRQIPTDHQILADYFIIDFKEKRVSLYDRNVKDSFIDTVKDLVRIKIEKNRIITLLNKYGEEIYLKLDEKGRIIGLKDENLRQCGSGYLYRNESIVRLDLPNLQLCGDNFLKSNRGLIYLSLPQLNWCGDDFLIFNKTIMELDLPQLEECGHGFMNFNRSLLALNLPNLKKCGTSFLFSNEILKELNLPKLALCKEKFLCFNRGLEELKLPNLQICGSDTLCFNNKIKTLDMPMLWICGDNFLSKNVGLTELYMPRLKECKHGFLGYNQNLIRVSLPSLQKCGDGMLYYNSSLNCLNVPNLQEVGDSFLFRNNTLTQLSIPNLKRCGHDFMYYNETLELLDLPKLQERGEYFLYCNNLISKLNLPRVKSADDLIM